MSTTSAISKRPVAPKTLPPTPDEQSLAASGDEPTLAVELERYPRSDLMPQVRELSRVNNWRSAALIAWQWVVILGVATAAVMIGTWWAYVLAGIIIAGRQQALGVMVHDATHYLLFTNRTVNDIASDLFLGFPIGLSTTLYREHHFRHHRFTNTDDDPDWVNQHKDKDWIWPKSRREALSLLVRSFFGLNLYRVANVFISLSPAMNLFRRPIDKNYPLRARVLFVVTGILIYAVLIGTGLIIPAILLYMIPGLTLASVFNRLRATAEHVRVSGDHELNATRTVLPTLLERVLIAPFGVNYHLEHHLYPSIPGPRLAEAHRLLMQDERFRGRAHLTPSYLGLRKGLLGELMTPEPSTADQESAGPAA